VSSRSGVAGFTANCYIRILYFYFYVLVIYLSCAHLTRIYLTKGDLLTQELQFVNFTSVHVLSTNPILASGYRCPHVVLRGPRVEHSNSGKKSLDSIRFDSRYRIDFFDSIRFGNLINLPLVHRYSNSKLGVIFIVCIA